MPNSNFLNRFKKLTGKQKESSPVRAEFIDFGAEISPSGDFQVLTNLDCVLHSWKNLLLTPTRTYLFDPEYGSDVHKYIFEPMDYYTADGILRETRDKIELYDNRAPIVDSRVVLLTGEKGYGIELTVKYGGTKKHFLVPIIEENLLDSEGF